MCGFRLLLLLEYAFRKEGRKEEGLEQGFSTSFVSGFREDRGAIAVLYLRYRNNIFKMGRGPKKVENP